MAATEPIAGDGGPVVRLECDRFVDPGRCTVAYDGAFKESDELALRKVVDLSKYLPRAITSVIRVSATDEIKNFCDVSWYSNTHLEPGCTILGH
jgi:hypothetical protein